MTIRANEIMLLSLSYGNLDDVIIIESERELPVWLIGGYVIQFKRFNNGDFVWEHGTQV